MKILIVDDSKDFRALIRLYLSKALKEAETFEYDVEALGKPSDSFEWSDYDVLLLDYNLGGGEDGFEWLKKYRDLKSFPPTIILTAEGDEYIAVKAIKLGAVDYLNKVDVTPKRLAEVIEEAIEYTPQVKEEQEEEIKNAEHLIAEIHKKENEALPDQGMDIGYKFVRKIGQGAMSKAYLAERTEDRLSLVLKVLDIQNSPNHATIDRFVLEAELIEELDSPFVVKIYEHGLTDDYGFIAMEFFSRGDMRQRMELNIPPELAATYMLHVAYGLEAIHKIGVVHRDLKPANVMFRGDDSLALADFGISKKMNAESSLTEIGQIMGTPHYMSPEQGEGKKVDHRTDLYSAGVMLYEMLVKAKPFKAANPAALIYKHVNEEVPRLPAELSRFQGVIDKLMAKKPDDRMQTASELIDKLAALE